MPQATFERDHAWRVVRLLASALIQEPAQQIIVLKGGGPAVVNVGVDLGQANAVACGLIAATIWRSASMGAPRSHRAE